MRGQQGAGSLQFCFRRKVRRCIHVPSAFRPLMDVGRSSHRIAHIMQTVEKCHKVIILSGIVFGLSHLELNAVADTSLLGPLLTAVSMDFS